VATDNSTILNGDIIRNKLRTTVKTQVVGLDINIGGGTEKLVQAGQQTMANSLPVVLPSDQVAANSLTTNLTVVTPTVTVSTTPAYSANDVVGGKLTLSSVFRVANDTVRLDSITVLDNANQKASMYLVLFNANPTAATLTDNAALAFSTDFTKIVGTYFINTSDFVTLNSKAIYSKSDVGLLLKGTETSLYAALVTTGTPTYTATTDLTLRLGFSRDC